MTGYIILLLGGLQGIFLSVVIYSKKAKQPANRYLAAFVLLLGLGCILDNSFMSLDENVFVVIWSGNSFLFAPFLYLYIKRLLKSFKLDLKIVLIHFSIFVLMKVIVITFFYSSPVNEQWVTVVGAALNLFLAIFNVCYGLLILKILTREKKSLEANQLKWTRAITVFFISYTGLLLLRRVLTELFVLKLPFIDDFIYVGVAFAIYWISYQIINQPNLILLKEKKYAKSGLIASDVEHYGQKINSYLSTSKAFTQSEFSFDSLSINLNIPKHQLSQIISEHFGKSFYELVNELRIKEVKKLLDSNEYKHLSILGIAMECGFQSKSAFNTAFRKITGKTPSQYLKST